MKSSEKLALFRSLFVGREDVYGTYDVSSGRAWQVKRPCAEQQVYDHLRGLHPLAIYPLINGDQVRFGVIDIDHQDGNPPLEAVHHAAQLGFSGYVEASRAKGFHVWFFFREAVSAWKVRALLSLIVEEIGCGGVEIFPKQSKLRSGGFGNCINLPLFGKHVQRKATVFLDRSLRPHRDQWQCLSTIQGHSSDELNSWLELNDIRSLHPTHSNSDPELKRAFGLMPCAQQMLRKGVTFNQRVACFRLAVQLRKTGLPGDMALQTLQTWAQKNEPENGKERLSEQEVVAQTKSAYGSIRYSGCGCEEEPMKSFCDESCWLKKV